jgi:hypothetical protein
MDEKTVAGLTRGVCEGNFWQTSVCCQPAVKSNVTCQKHGERYRLWDRSFYGSREKGIWFLFYLAQLTTRCPGKQIYRVCRVFGRVCVG